MSGTQCAQHQPRGQRARHQNVIITCCQFGNAKEREATQTNHYYYQHYLC